MVIHHIDGMDNVNNQNVTLTAQRYLTDTTLDQQLRRAGRYDTASLWDSSGGSMNNGFGRSLQFFELDGAETYRYIGADIYPTRGIGGTFSHNGDFLELNSVVSGVRTKQVRLAIRTDGRIQLWKGTGNQLTGTMVAETATGVLNLNTWARLEVEFGFTTGIRVRVDETLVIDEPGLNLLNGAALGITRVGRYWEHFGFDAIMWDNIMVWSDNSEAWLGNLQVATYWPYNGAEADVEPGSFSPNSGTNLYSRIYERGDFPSLANEYPNSDTNYIYTAAATEAYFRMQQPVVFDPIVGIGVTVQAKCVSGANHYGVANDGSLSYLSPAQSLSGSSYVIDQFIFRVRPDNNSAWSFSDLMGGNWLFGINVDAPASEYRLSSLSIEVAHQRNGSVLNRNEVY